MTVYSFLVGAGILWFVCFLYVVQGIARGETTIFARLSHPVTDPKLQALHHARTRVKRGAPPV